MDVEVELPSWAVEISFDSGTSAHILKPEHEVKGQHQNQVQIVKPQEREARNVGRISHF